MTGGEVEIRGRTITFDAPDWDMEPPGSYTSIVMQPRARARHAMEVAIFHEHRFAFYFWTKWARGRGGRPAPALVSLDWHRDLVPPTEHERSVLDGLDLGHSTGITVASWVELHPHNDGHVLAAAHLGLIGDVYVLQKHDDGPENDFVDGHGTVHRVSCFGSASALLDELRRQEIQEVYFDIDLDYFTESDEPDGGGDVELVAESDVRELLDPNGSLMEFVFPRMCGMTIALEPEFCGGLRNAHRLLEWVDTTLFDPGLGHRDCTWRHLTGR